jgi:hypothetical protein
MWSRAADAGAAAPDGGGTSRWRPRSPLQLQRSYGARSWHCLALGGDPLVLRGHKVVDLANSSSGYA